MTLPTPTDVTGTPTIILRRIRQLDRYAVQTEREGDQRLTAPDGDPDAGSLPDTEGAGRARGECPARPTGWRSCSIGHVGRNDLDGIATGAHRYRRHAASGPPATRDAGDAAQFEERGLSDLTDAARS